jgi:hypothetical protein
LIFEPIEAASPINDSIEPVASPTPQTFVPKPDFTEKTRFKSAAKTVNLNNLLKVEAKKGDDDAASNPALKKEDRPFTDQALAEAWKTFAETRKVQQGDYQLLNLEFERHENKIVMPLTNPIQETMLNEFRTELNAFLRERLQNNTIQVVGELREDEDKKMIYTPRDKFDYLMEKNPLIKELKDTLGLDPDF